MAYKGPVALFLFAHQDDEFGVFQKILDERLKGNRVFCAYLTNGGFGGVSPKRRNRESLFVLNHLGVQKQNVFFPGQTLAIPDMCLYEHLESASKWISQWLTSFSQVVSICVPAWEGGHHDHDMLHAITVRIAEARGILRCMRQFSLYNSYGCIGQFFKVLTPIPMNGAVEEIRIPLKHRLNFLSYCLCYPSQAKSWLGIFPFVVLHYLTNGKQVLQPVSPKRIRIRPHHGALYYEKRGFFTWKKMASCLSGWQNIGVK